MYLKVYKSFWGICSSEELRVSRRIEILDALGVTLEGWIDCWGRYNPLIISAINGGHMEIVKTLIHLKADVNTKFPNCSALSSAVSLETSACEGITKALLQAGANPRQVDVFKSTPLHVARHDMVSLLTQYNADVNAQNFCLRTPLHKAALRRDADTIRALIRASANVDARDDEGKIPLDLAPKALLSLFPGANST